MAVYDNKKIPVPENSRITISRSEGKRPIVYAVLGYGKSAAGNPIPKRVIIGYITDEDDKLMYPTDGYKRLYPQDWEKRFNEKVSPASLKIGMYTFTSAVCENTGLKDIMDSVFGADSTRALLDFAMYSILHQSDVTSAFESKMADELLFNNEPLSDSYYSNLFEKKIKQEQIMEFRKQWALKCKEDGAEDIWICIDGSNDDCKSKGVIFAEKGKAKSKKNVNIVSFTYAVTVEGKPITFDLYRGGLVDAKAMRQIISFLDECGFKVRGVILDRGYCDSKAIQFLADNKLPYVIMIKGNPEGYATAVTEFGEQIKMNAEFWVHGTRLFAAQKAVKLFKGLSHEDNVTVFYDFANGDGRIGVLMDKVNKEVNRIDKALLDGKSPKVEPKLSKIINIEEGENRKHAVINTEAMQEAMDEKGLYGIVTSEEMSPAEIHKLYSSRDASEKQYAFIKTQLGYGTVRVHYTNGTRAKFACAFISSIIRHELRRAANAVDKITTQGIRELELEEMERVNSTYALRNALTGRQIAILEQVGKDLAYEEEIVNIANKRLNGERRTVRHRKPGPKKGVTKGKESALSDEKTEAKDTSSVAREPAKRGPKPGFKRGIYNKDGSVRKKPGCKPGTVRGKLNKDGTPRKKPGPKKTD